MRGCCMVGARGPAVVGLWRGGLGCCWPPPAGSGVFKPGGHFLPQGGRLRSFCFPTPHPTPHVPLCTALPSALSASHEAPRRAGLAGARGDDEEGLAVLPAHHPRGTAAAARSVSAKHPMPVKLAGRSKPGCIPHASPHHSFPPRILCGGPPRVTSRAGAAGWTSRLPSRPARGPEEGAYSSNGCCRD